MTLLQQLQQLKKQGKKTFFPLLDPDFFVSKELKPFLEPILELQPLALLVGGSLLNGTSTEKFIHELKSITKLPVYLFPGGNYQLCPNADGVLFLSLLSGRNPEYLIGQHVHAAPYIKKYQLETLATAYLLVGEDSNTSVCYISNTRPIPSSKPAIVVATALAAQYLGMQAVYLESGSGAKESLNEQVVKAVKSSVELPLLVGGGIKNEAEMQKLWDAGADVLVLGSIFESQHYKE